MDLSEVMTISGKPGLYRIISQSPGRIIVESLLDGKRGPVFMRHNFSILKEISIYTEEGDMPLEDAFAAIYKHEEGKASIDPKKPGVELAAYLEEIVPDYDKEEVRHADMKKLFKWYNLLVEKNLWDPSDIDSETDTETSKEEEE
jgi:hypothetical protein